jgi:AcrR family transcriptional regulator
MPKITDEKKQQRRTDILNAAVELFAGKGFHGVNTAEIADRAGIAEGTVFRYFPTKETLLIAALDSVVRQLLDALRREDDPDRPAAQRLLHFIGNHLRLIREHPDLARFLILELRQSPEFLMRNPQFLPLENYLGFLRELLETGMARGELRRADLECTVALIFGTMDYVLTRWHLLGADLDPDRMIADFRDIIYNGLKPEEI